MIDNQSRYDSRSGLGYGQTKDRFHKQRAAQSTYPYHVNHDEDIDFEADEEDLDAISSKLIKKLSFDPGAAKSVDSFYFAAGNTKLSDAYFRPEKLILEIETFSNSISPIPGLYSPMDLPNSSTSITSGNYKRIGSKKGFSSAHKKIEDEEKESQEQFYSLKDLVKIMRRKRGE